MLIRVAVQSESPLYLEIRDANPTDSIILERIDGLDPPDVDLFMGDYARDGGFYGGRRVPPRNISMVFELTPNYKLNESISSLRTKLYRSLMSPFDDIDAFNILLVDDILPDRYISAYVEKFDGDPFSEDTSLTMNLRCPNPYLIDSAATNLVGTGPQLTFPYQGSARTGFEVNATLTVASSSLTVDINGRLMKLSYAFQAGDKVYINTNRGSRRIQLTRTVNGVPVTSSLLFALLRGYPWLELRALANVLKLYGTDSTALVADVNTLAFRGKHWGI